ncbi:hypothetical protein D3C77_647860 [compost metagenome]
MRLTGQTQEQNTRPPTSQYPSSTSAAPSHRVVMGQWPAATDCSSVRGSLSGTVSSNKELERLPLRIQTPASGPSRKSPSTPNWLRRRSSRKRWARHQPSLALASAPG